MFERENAVMEIISATVDRAEDIGYVHATSWEKAYHGIVPKEFLDNFTPEKRTDIFRKTLTSSDKLSRDEFYVAYLNNQPMGMLVIGKSRDKDVNEKVSEIGAIYLLPGYWGKGYGKQLMDFAVNRLKELSYCKITLWVLEENKRARRFYERYGFVFDGAKKEINIGKPLIEVRYVYSVGD
jgi:GNAT superfamily N-acetyltransferase